MADGTPRTRWLEAQNTSQLLRISYQAYIALIHARLADRGYPDVRPTHGIVFQHLPSEGARVTELAERAQLTKQWMGALVEDLERMGYLERVPDPTDGRARLVRMTARGWELTRVTEAIISGIEAEWSSQLGERRFGQLRRLLRDLALSLE